MTFPQAAPPADDLSQCFDARLSYQVKVAAIAHWWIQGSGEETVYLLHPAILLCMLCLVAPFFSLS